MSFSKMKRDDLFHMAVENFAVDVDETANKAQIIAALAENGVTWEMAQTFDPAAQAVAAEEEVQDETVVAEVITPTGPIEDAVSSSPAAGTITTAQLQPAPKPLALEHVNVVVTDPDAKVLIRMERENPKYQFRGYTFTNKHPFALVAAKDVDALVTHEDGFYVATPREVQEYYA